MKRHRSLSYACTCIQLFIYTYIHREGRHVEMYEIEYEGVCNVHAIMNEVTTGNINRISVSSVIGYRSNRLTGVVDISYVNH